MKDQHLKKISSWLAIASLFATVKASAVSFNDVQFWTGTGTNRAALVIEWSTPEDFTGGVIGDLLGRRGQVQGQDTRGNAQVISAMVPLANMFGYINTLRSMSQGRAQYSMEFDHYTQVPQAIADEIKAKYA